MTASKYLLDTSALYPVMVKLREGILDYRDQIFVLDLTIYEVGNVLWKEAKKGKIRNLSLVAEMFEKVLSYLQVVRTDCSLGDVLQVAVSENLTYYDASYLQAARRLGCKLVTLDEDLLRYREAIDVDEFLKEIGSS